MFQVNVVSTGCNVHCLIVSGMDEYGHTFIKPGKRGLGLLFLILKYCVDFVRESKPRTSSLSTKVQLTLPDPEVVTVLRGNDGHLLTNH